MKKEALKKFVKTLQEKQKNIVKEQQKLFMDLKIVHDRLNKIEKAQKDIIKEQSNFILQLKFVENAIEKLSISPVEAAPQKTEKVQAPEQKTAPQKTEKVQAPEQKTAPQKTEKVQAPEQKTAPQKTEKVQAPEQKTAPQKTEKVQTPEQKTAPQKTEKVQKLGKGAPKTKEYIRRKTKKTTTPEYSLEQFFGTNIIAKIGVAMLLVGIAIAMQYFPNVIKILIGYLASLGLFGISVYLFNQDKDKYRDFAGLLAGGAVVAGYLTTLAATLYYEMFILPVAFIIYGVITAVGLILVYFNYENKIMPHIIIWASFFVPLFTGYFKEINYDSANYIKTYLIFANIALLAMLGYKYNINIHLSVISPNLIIILITYKYIGPKFLLIQFLTLTSPKFINMIYEKYKEYYISLGTYVALTFLYIFLWLLIYPQVKGLEGIFYKKYSILLLLGIASIVLTILSIIIKEEKLIYFIGLNSILLFSMIAIRILYYNIPITWITFYIFGIILIAAYFLEEFTEKEFITVALIAGVITFLLLLSKVLHNTSQILVAGTIIPIASFLIYRLTPEKSVNKTLLTAVLLITTYFSGIGILTNLLHYRLHINKVVIITIISYTALYAHVLAIIYHKNKNIFKTLSLISFGLTILLSAIFAWKFSNPEKISKATFITYEIEKIVSYLSIIGITLYLYYNKNLSDIKLGKFPLKDIYVFILTLLVITFELIAFANRFKLEYLDRATISIAWGLIILTFVYLGIVKKVAFWRIGSVALTLILVMKILIYDIANISTPKKILVFIAIGITLTIAGYFYQKYRDKLTE